MTNFENFKIKIVKKSMFNYNIFKKTAFLGTSFMYKKIFLLLALFLFLINTNSFAAGYRLPETSFTSLALSGANFAGTKDADASYYNPAKMSFINKNRQWETGVLYIALPEVGFNGVVSGTPINTKSRKETFFIPFFHYIHDKKSNGPRYGFSLVMPAGLSKRWDNPFAKLFAEEFTLKVGELNPSASWKLSKNFSIGLGARLLYAEGCVRQAHPLNQYSLELTGDALDVGFNISLYLKGSETFDFALAYRSKIDLNLEGNSTGSLTGTAFSTSANLTVPVPAQFNFGINYNINKKTSMEICYDKTFWSEYESIDFNYSNPVIEATFGKPSIKNWDDSTAIRFGIKHILNDRVTLMGGLGRDNNPVPIQTMSFEHLILMAIFSHLESDIRLKMIWI